MASVRDNSQPQSLTDRLSVEIERHFGTDILDATQVRDVLEATSQLQSRVMYSIYESHRSLVERFEHFLALYAITHRGPAPASSPVPDQPRPLDDRLGGGPGPSNPKLN